MEINIKITNMPDELWERFSKNGAKSIQGERGFKPTLPKEINLDYNKFPIEIIGAILCPAMAADAALEETEYIINKSKNN